MLTNAALQFPEGHEADECNCPACLPACERMGRKCFIECDRCKAKVEADDIGPLKSLTRRVHYMSNMSKRRVVEVSPEIKEFNHLLKTIEERSEAAGLLDFPA